MNRNELVTSVATKTGLTKEDTSNAINALLETITENLVKGDNVPFIGFGTFSTTKRAARDGVNPSTGAKIKIAATTVAKFKVGARLKNSIRDAK